MEMLLLGTRKGRVMAGAVALMLLLSFATLALGQGIITGSISGTVMDSSGAVIAGAAVTAKNQETNQTFNTISNGAGIFAVAGMPPGHYTIVVTAAKFAKAQVAGVEVIVGRQTSVSDIHLQVGSGTEVVEVTGAAPLVEIGTAQITNSIESKAVSDLPIGRGLDELSLFLPGVTMSGSVSRSNSNGAQMSVNGQRQRSNNFQIDGQSMNDTSVAGPGIFIENNDLVAEYQVLTHYDAQYGRNLGSQVNVITKSGGNAFHGTGFETWRGSTFDSLTNTEKSTKFGFCDPHNPNDTPALTGCSIPQVSRAIENFFGGTIGGPIKKDKAWFFASAFWDRFRGSPSPSESSLLTPTPAGMTTLTSTFPNSPGVGFLKKYGPAVVAGATPTFSNLTTVPVTVGGTTAQVQMGTPSRIFNSPSNIRQFSGRGDVQLSSKDRVFARYLIDDEANLTTDAFGDGAAGFVVDVPSRGQQIGGDWSRQFSNTMVNQVRFNWSRLWVAFEGGNTGCTRATIANCPTNIAFQDGTTLAMGIATNNPQGRQNDYWEIQDNATKLVGRHQFKWGMDYSHQNSPSTFLPVTNGQYIFPTFSDFIANTPFRAALTDGSPTLSYKEKDLGLYFQDDWRLTDRLTVQLGMRWEYFSQGINLLHELTLAQQTGPRPFWNTALPLDRTTVAAVPADLNNFGPIFGFSWQPKDKTIVRGGFRIAYDTTFYNIASNTATGAPTVNAGTLTVGTDPVVPGLPSSGFTGAAVQAVILPLLPRGSDPGLRSQTLVASNFKSPYSEQWTFGIERELSSRMAFETRYVGNHGVGLYQNVNGNPALNPLIAAGFAGVIPAGVVPCADSTQPGFGTGAVRGHVDCARRNVNLRTNSAFNSYNGLQNSFRIRDFHGLTSTLSYTWAHNIDNASEIFSTTGAGLLSFPQNSFNTGNGERANSNYDYRHTVGLTMIYDLPFFRGQNGLLARILGGWQPNVTYRYSTGQPFNLLQSKSSSIGTSGASSLCDPTGTFSTSTDACRPILSNKGAPFNSVGVYKLVGGVPTLFNLSTGLATTTDAVHWLANNPVAARVLGTPFAGMARNSLNGQPIHAMNFAMQKNTKINERFTLQLRATAFNVLNHQYLGLPGNSLTSVPGLTSAPALGSFDFKSAGGGSVGATEAGIGRRRLEFTGKIVF